MTRMRLTDAGGNLARGVLSHRRLSSPERNAALCQMARDNPCLSRSAIAVKFGISRERVRQLLKKHGERTKRYAPKKSNRRVCRCGNEFYGGHSCYCPDCRAIPIICDNCGKLFARHIMDILRQYNPEDPLAKASGFFCSLHCHGVWLGQGFGFRAHPENSRKGKRNEERWNLVWQKHLETGFGAPKLARLLRVPEGSVGAILARRRKELAGRREA